MCNPVKQAPVASRAEGYESCSGEWAEPGILPATVRGRWCSASVVMMVWPTRGAARRHRGFRDTHEVPDADFASTFGSPRRIHAHRTFGGDRDYRGPDRPAAPRGAVGPRGGAADPVHQQPEAAWPGTLQL